MLSGLFSKIASESLLSLYPVFVKNIHLPLDIQMWSRFFTYVAISVFFIDYSYIATHFFSVYGLLLMGITILHVYSSYVGFLLLDSGIAYTVFYIYPILILLLSGKIDVPFLVASVFTLFGIYLLMNEKHTSIPEPDAPKNTEEGFGIDTEKSISSNSTPTPTPSTSPSYLGYFWIGIAALTEALIYFVVKKLKTKNNWNHLFLSYGVGSIGFTLYHLYTRRIFETSWTQWQTLLSLAINSCIGLFGYLLRFYAISHLETTWYATLSYLGVLMAYVYGILLNHEQITWMKIIGTLCILGPNIYRIHKYPST